MNLIDKNIKCQYLSKLEVLVNKDTTYLVKLKDKISKLKYDLNKFMYEKQKNDKKINNLTNSLEKIYIKKRKYIENKI